MGFNSKKYAENNIRKGEGLSLQDGRNIVRLAPPSAEYFTNDISYACYKYIIHYNIGESSMICPRSATPDKPFAVHCPICAKIWGFKKQVGKLTQEQKEALQRIQAKDRWVFNAVNITAKPGEGGKHIIEPWIVGWTIFKNIDLWLKSGDYGDLLDINNSRGLIIHKTPAEQTKSNFVEYGVSTEPNDSDISEVLASNWKKQLTAAKDFVDAKNKTIPSLEEIYEMMELSGNPYLMGENSSSTKRIPPKPVAEDDDSNSDLRDTTTDDEDSVNSEDEDEAMARLEAELQEKEKKEAVAESNTQGPPECFGEYNSSNKECKSCGSRRDCIKERISG